jgi:hypothetical protein
MDVNQVNWAALDGWIGGIGAVIAILAAVLLLFTN